MKNFEKRTNLINVEGVDLQFDNEGFVMFGDVARNLLNQQSQYASRYADDLDKDYPNLGKNLRIQGDCGYYHGMKIYKDDIEEFVNRVRKYKGNQN